MMSQFGERIVLFFGDVAGSDGTGSPPRETDGFLTVTLAGSDKNWSYATAVIETLAGGVKTVVGETTWAYAAQQDFKKSVSVTVPIKKGEAILVGWSAQRNAEGIKARVQWIPCL